MPTPMTELDPNWRNKVGAGRLAAATYFPRSSSISRLIDQITRLGLSLPIEVDQETQQIYVGDNLYDMADFLNIGSKYLRQAQQYARGYGPKPDWEGLSPGVDAGPRRPVDFESMIPGGNSRYAPPPGGRPGPAGRTPSPGIPTPPGQPGIPTPPGQPGISTPPGQPGISIPPRVGHSRFVGFTGEAPTITPAPPAQGLRRPRPRTRGTLMNPAIAGYS